jgi:hypothetical protein
VLRAAAACNELFTQLSEYLAAAGPVAAISVLYARIKAIEEPDGSWPGGDVVDVLTEWFASRGCDLSLATAEDSQASAATGSPADGASSPA